MTITFDQKKSEIFSTFNKVNIKRKLKKISSNESNELELSYQICFELIMKIHFKTNILFPFSGECFFFIRTQFSRSLQSANTRHNV